MEKNDTKLFKKTEKKEEARSFASSLAGSALGSASSIWAKDLIDERKTNGGEEKTDSAGTGADIVDTVDNNSNAAKDSNTITGTNTGSDVPSKTDTQTDVVNEIIPEDEVSEVVNVPEPVEPEPKFEETFEPVEEIDPLDNELADLIEDVSDVDVVYDINGNPMVVASVHNSFSGDLYLVDADMDGDFDVLLDQFGNPMVDLVGANDKLITYSDVDVMMNDGYVEPSGFDDMLTAQVTTNEEIQQDIFKVDEPNV